RLVHAIDRAVVGHTRTGHARDRWKEVDAMNDLIADPASGHVTRPADDERHANAALPRGEVLAAPRSRPAVVGPDELRSVVAGEDHDGVVADAEAIDGVEHLPDVDVHLGQH